MSILGDILLSVYPRHCSACNKVISKERYLCEKCEKLILFNDKPCIKCGGVKGNCRCGSNVYRFAGCVTPIVNDRENTAMNCIYNYKLSDNGEIADFFSALIVAMIRKEYADVSFEAVTSVPTTYLKAQAKGYDHSMLLAKKVAAGIKVPYQTMLIKRTSHSQHNMKKKERFEKARGIFKPSGEFQYENVLLIDDLITTGATLDECTRELMFAGVKNVYCAAAVTIDLAKSEKKEYNENGEEK